MKKNLLYFLGGLSGLFSFYVIMVVVLLIFG